MPVFAPVNNPNDTSDQTVKNLPFFPGITVKGFRDSTRSQDTVTDGRVIEALRSSIITVNDQLSEWREAQELLNYATLADVPSDDYMIEGGNAYSELTHHYYTAVYSFAKASLLEKFRDVGTTTEGAQRADDFEQSEEGYRREARKSIRKILGKPFVTIELI